MKYQTFIDPKKDEEVLIYAHERNSLVLELERILRNEKDIIGVNQKESILINLETVSCFISLNNKVYALIKNERYQVKEKLYQLEEILGPTFIKINQSCIANIKQIKSFQSSIGGAIKVTFKNNYIDFVSRRKLKEVKERIGL